MNDNHRTRAEPLANRSDRADDSIELLLRRAGVSLNRELEVLDAIWQLLRRVVPACVREIDHQSDETASARLFKLAPDGVSVLAPNRVTVIGSDGSAWGHGARGVRQGRAGRSHLHTLHGRPTL